MKASLRQRLRRSCVSSLLATGMLAFLATAGICAEIYTSGNTSYPGHFKNVYQNDSNELDQMDVVSFGGREIIFFTVRSFGNKESDSYTRALRYFTPGFDYSGHMDVQNSSAFGWRFKTAVFNNVIYLFYTANIASVYESNRIYYRTITVEIGETEADWKLLFSEQKSLPAAIDYAEIRMVEVMNGELYVIFSDRYYEEPYIKYGNHWYYLSSTDGVTFSPATPFFTSTDSPMGWWTSGAVFSVPDAAGGWSEKLMIAYATGGDLIYSFFFDGEANGYGHRSIRPGLPTIKSVRLVPGTANGYTDNKHAIQVFFTTPSTSSGTPNPQWAYMYHGEYLPSGPNGDVGTWSSVWGHLWLSNAEGVHCEYNFLTDPNWAVIPVSTSEADSVRMNLRIWYFRGAEYHYEPFGLGYDVLLFRKSSYQSDIMEALPRMPVPTVPDLSTATVVGVIEGPPPFPENIGFPDQVGLDISTVVITDEYGMTFSTTWSAGVGVAVSYGEEFGPVGAKAELSSELKYTKESTDEYKVSRTNKFFSYDYTIPGGLGWVLLLKPQILIDPYVLRSYNGKPLNYDAITQEVQVLAISYGPGTTLEPQAYLLENPSAPFGNDTYTSIFAGMQPRPLSTRVHDWMWEVDCDLDGTCADTSYSVYLTEDGGYNPLLMFGGTQGSQNELSLTHTTTEAETNGTSVSFSASATAFGFTTEGKVNYSMDVKTSTSMTQSLGFLYNVQPCALDGSSPCVGSIDVYPYMLIPNEDDSGYAAPWISDDIRTYRKPKPWSIAYRTVPSSAPGDTALDVTKVTVRKANGTLFLDRSDWNRDRMTAKLTLEGITPDFFLHREDYVYLRLGNYAINSDSNFVVSRTIQGNHLILELSEAEDSDARIRMELSHDSARSLLDIFVDADHIDLSHLQAHPFLGTEMPNTGGAHNASYSFHLGGEYYAAGDLVVRCADNDKKAICNFHIRKN